jgi:hypothetical protein
MAEKTDDTPPKGVIGTTTLHKNRFTINCATCGEKQTVRAPNRSDAWMLFKADGWQAYMAPGTSMPTHAVCARCGPR